MLPHRYNREKATKQGVKYVKWKDVCFTVVISSLIPVSVRWQQKARNFAVLSKADYNRISAYVADL